MRSVRSGSLTTAVVLACLGLALHSAFGGGSGLNVVVVVNQTSANSSR